MLGNHFFLSIIKLLREGIMESTTSNNAGNVWTGPFWMVMLIYCLSCFVVVSVLGIALAVLYFMSTVV